MLAGTPCILSFLSEKSRTMFNMWQLLCLATLALGLNEVPQNIDDLPPWTTGGPRLQLDPLFPWSTGGPPALRRIKRSPLIERKPDSQGRVKVPGKLQAKSEILISGTVMASAKSFCVSMAKGGNLKKADIGLQMCPSLQLSRVTWNSRVKGKFGKKLITTTLPDFKEGKEFAMRIVMQKKKYQIQVYDKTVGVFPVRKGIAYKTINYVIVKGDVKIDNISFKNLKSKPTARKSKIVTENLKSKPTARKSKIVTENLKSKPTARKSEVVKGDLNSKSMSGKSKGVNDYFNKPIKYGETTWTIIQLRSSADVDFYKGWSDYERGFGNRTSNFWYGLNAIHNMCNKNKTCKLRIELCYKDEGADAKYSIFYIDGADEKYKLHVSGYSGDAGDSLSYHDGMKFSTYDNDNSNVELNCASRQHGAWWYLEKECHKSNLNGGWAGKDAKGINWFTFGRYDSMGFSRIMVHQN